MKNRQADFISSSPTMRERGRRLQYRNSAAIWFANGFITCLCLVAATILWVQS